MFRRIRSMELAQKYAEMGMLWYKQAGTASAYKPIPGKTISSRWVEDATVNKAGEWGLPKSTFRRSIAYILAIHLEK